MLTSLDIDSMLCSGSSHTHNSSTSEQIMLVENEKCQIELNCEMRAVSVLLSSSLPNDIRHFFLFCCPSQQTPPVGIGIRH